MFKSKFKFLIMLMCFSIFILGSTLIFCAQTQTVGGEVSVTYEKPKELLIYEKNTAGTEYKVVGYNEDFATTVLQIPDTRKDENGKSLPVTEIGDRAFSSSSKFTSLKIGGNVKKIGARAFFSCTSLKGKLTLPSGLTSIGEYAFAYCSGFSGTLSFPTGITTIPNSAFYLCKFSGDFVVPNNITSIEQKAFSYNSFTSLTLHKNITFLGTEAFSHCSSLSTINYNIINYNSSTSSVFGSLKASSDSREIVFNLGDSVQLFLFGNMLYNTYITELNVGKHVIFPPIASPSLFNIGTNCLNKIYVDKENSSFTSRDKTETIECNVLIAKSSKKLIFGSKNSGDMSNLDITAIENYAFYGCPSLTSVKIPSAVKSIGSNAFANCKQLNEVIIDSPTIYSAISSSASSNGYLTYNLKSGTGTIKVLASADDGSNTYLNNATYFTKSSTMINGEDYNVYTKK